MQNKDIREYAKSKKINLWQISEKLGYAHETRFSRVLRHELSSDKKEELRSRSPLSGRFPVPPPFCNPYHILRTTHSTATHNTS